MREEYYTFYNGLRIGADKMETIIAYLIKIGAECEVLYRDEIVGNIVEGVFIPC